MSSLKQRTVSGIKWSLIENLAQQVITFIIGIILARLLNPREFGLVGMVTIFFAISQTFIDSGFGQALIRKKDCTENDYSTVFYFNLVVAFLLFWILFFAAPFISTFFNEPQLTNIIRVQSLTLIFSSFSIIQTTILTKRIDFKLLTKVSVYASIISGIIAIILALLGWGVWSLVYRSILTSFFVSIFLWIWNRWIPILVFSKTSFNELFFFGSKLLISYSLDTIFKNIYYLVIGRFFAAETLGFYTRANGFKDLPSNNISIIVSRVSYPVLSNIQDNQILLKQSLKKFITHTVFITFVLMLGLVAVSESLIIGLLGEKWHQSIVLLQMLCFVGLIYPLHFFNLTVLNVLGRSDLFLKLEIFKKFLAIPIIVLGIFFGIKAMIIGMIINSIFGYFINSYWTARLIDYPIGEQLVDIWPSFLIASISALFVFIIGELSPFKDIINLIVQLCAGAIIVILIGEISKNKTYISLREIALSFIRNE